MKNVLSGKKLSLAFSLFQEEFLWLPEEKGGEVYSEYIKLVSFLQDI